VKEYKDYETFKTISEPCESTCFSAYVNSKGDYFPCSFTEGQDEWVDGLSVPACKNFVKDIWNHEKSLKFRNELFTNNRNCPIFEV
jgi:hypothetical protein